MLDKVDAVLKSLDELHRDFNALLAENSRLKEANTALLKFVQVAIGAAFQGGDMDGGSIQDLAVMLGILVEVPYDPEKNGTEGLSIVDPGDPWFVYAAQYATPEPTCKTCHGVGDVTLTVMRQPDEYENVPCPDCQGEDTP